MMRDINERLVRSLHDAIAIICHVNRPRKRRNRLPRKKSKKLTRYFWVTLDENAIQSQRKCDDIAIYLRHSHDSRETFAQVSHLERLNIILFHFLAI